MPHESDIDATYLGLHKWYCHMFEKLGWMLLAQKHGNMEKITTYKHSIDRLIKAIENKQSYIKCDDKKHDLELMRQNVVVLKDHVAKDFPQAGGARKGSRKGSCKGSKGRK